MKPHTTVKHSSRDINRRDFIKIGSGAVALLAHAPITGNAFAKRRRRRPKPKNIVLIITDQQHMDTIAAGGCRHVRTPALDRLKKNSVSFTQSYSANPLCSPARSAVFTGRTSSECAVHVNGRPIRSDIPNLGQWLSEQTDYETFYAGKWHLPRTYTSRIPGFKVINTGIGGFGYLCDTVMSRACEGFLRNRNRAKPFFLVASFMQPHDICEWLRLNMNNTEKLRYPELAGALPELPGNFEYDRNEPDTIRRKRRGNEPFKGKWDKEHWRYYRWSYYRHIEYVDAEIGRVLQAIEDSGHAHHIVSGLDITPTLCDYAGIRPPAHMRGVSLRGILEASGRLSRDFIVSEVSTNTGRMVRTEGYKYITYKDNLVEQLFDMKTDPGETKNLDTLSRNASVLVEHRKLLKEWENQLDVPSNVPNGEVWRHKG